jgi:hypothetical protein
LSTLKSKKIVVKMNDHGIMVYDEVAQTTIDMFPNNEEGQENALALVQHMMED